MSARTGRAGRPRDRKGAIAAGPRRRLRGPRARRDLHRRPGRPAAPQPGHRLRGQDPARRREVHLAARRTRSSPTATFTDRARPAGLLETARLTVPAAADPKADLTVTAIRFTGDANPYGGGDPYADYRTADFPFTRYADLADRQLGAGVIAANDEFFAQRENLLRARAPPSSTPSTSGTRARSWTAGRPAAAAAPRADHPWPTAEDHDWALVRLGAPGRDPRHRRRHRPLPRQLPAGRVGRGRVRARASPVPGGTPRRTT